MGIVTTQNTFTAGEINAASLKARTDLDKYHKGAATLLNMLVHPHGGASKRAGFLLLAELPEEVRLIPFSFNPKQSYALLFGNHKLWIANDQGLLLSDTNEAIVLESPYSLEQAKELSFVQSGDVLFLAHQQIHPHTLKRFSHNKWQFEKMSFTPTINPPKIGFIVFQNKAVKSDGKLSPAQCYIRYTYYVTAVNKDGKESDASAPLSIDGPASNAWQAGDYIELLWYPVPDAVEYRVYKGDNGGRPLLIDIVVDGSTTIRDANKRGIAGDSFPKWENPFADNNFPALVGIYEQRLVFLSTPKNPQTIFMSQTGDYFNFSKSIPQKASDSLDLTIAAQEVEPFNWLLELENLILGGGSGEWKIKSSEGAFSPKTAQAKKIGHMGSSNVQALLVGNNILQVGRSGKTVRGIQYDSLAESFNNADLSILAKHLFSSRHILSWTYQSEPSGIVWCVMSDGILLGLTFQSEHEVCAWHQHKSQGVFLSVLSLTNGQTESLLSIIKRGNRFFLEKMDSIQFEDLDNSVYLDSAIQYEGKKTKILNGLEHMEGQEICIIGDGVDLGKAEVKDGKVTLEREVTKALVGLDYEAKLESMPVEISGEEGSSLGRKKQINKINVLLAKTILAEIGTNKGGMEQVRWRRKENYGASLQPFSGIKAVTIPNPFSHDLSIIVKSSSPYPLTVLAFMPELSVR